ncbi:hypothetical protein GCM10029992_19820 [Glycomyces albus]
MRKLTVGLALAFVAGVVALATPASAAPSATAQSPATAQVETTDAVSPQQACTYRVISTTGLNVRSGPGTNYSVIGSVPYGHQFTTNCNLVGGGAATACGYYSNIWKPDGGGGYLFRLCLVLL